VPMMPPPITTTRARPGKADAGVVSMAVVS
jgi:hypothetical protein